MQGHGNEKESFFQIQLIKFCTEAIYMNKSILDMATVQCNSYDIVEQMKSF